jgi:hypothetical protein
MSIAGSAESALQAMVGTESLLQWMQHAIIGGHSFHRGDRGAVGLHREHEARTHRLAVYQYSAGAARTVFAADMGSGQSQILAQCVGERTARLDLDTEPCAIDRKFCPHAAACLLL